MTTVTPNSSPQALQNGGWAIVGNAIVIKNIQLRDGRLVDATIEKPGVAVPDGFCFEIDYLRELREVCARVGNQFQDPCQFAILYSENDRVCYAQSLVDRANVINYLIPPNPQMVGDCRRISQLTGSHLTAVASSSALTFVRPDSIERTPLPAPSAPPQAIVEDALIRILNTVPQEGTGARFAGVMHTPLRDSAHKQALVRLSQNPQERDDAEMKKWLIQLAQKAYDEYFTEGKNRKEYRAWLSAQWVIALLLRGENIFINIDPLTRAIAEDMLKSQGSCAVM